MILYIKFTVNILIILLSFHNILIWALEQFLLIIEDKGDNNYNYTIDYERNYWYYLFPIGALQFSEILDFHKIILIIHQSSLCSWMDKLVHVTSNFVYESFVLSRMHDNWLLFHIVYMLYLFRNILFWGLAHAIKQCIEISSFT